VTLIPHPEVVNGHPKVLIIGHGWVGQHIHAYFTGADWVDESGEIHADGEPHEHYDLGFICVPTPPLESGRCDTSIVREAYARWSDRVDWFCIKSTVEIGTTRGLGDNVCFSPEYVGETLGHPLADPDRQPFIILGGLERVTREFAEAWTLVTHANTRIYQVDAETAELCKLMENSWLATKVTFCNEFFDLAERMGLDYNVLREIWLADPRITRSHTYVYRDNRGFGGKCLPKDVTNLVKYFEQEWLHTPRLMAFVLDYNERLREGG